MAFLLLSGTRVNAGNPTDINLGIGYVDPEQGENGSQRSPVLIPRVGIDDYTLVFYTPCDGCTLRLLDENGNIAFATVIPAGTSSMVLPSYLSGEYTILLISGQFCYYGLINI